MTPLRWTRTLRTPHSERLLAFRDGREAVAVELTITQPNTIQLAICQLHLLQIQFTLFLFYV